MHYVDEGPAGAETVLLLHGQPTWCYLYRTVVARLAACGLRAVAPDLVGFGRSDKPVARTAHSVGRHVEWMAQFVDVLRLRHLTLVVQDWGGPIGLGLLGARPGLVRRVVAANTALHTADAGLAGRLAWACHANADGTVTVEQTLLDYQRLTQEVTPFRPSLFVQGATVSEVPDAVLAAYDAPFPDEASCAGPRQLPLLMGLTPGSECARLNRRTLEVLGRFEGPFLTAFSDGDPGTRRLGGGPARPRPRRRRAGAPHARGRRALPPGGTGRRAGRRGGRGSWGKRPPPDYEAGVDFSAPAVGSRRQRLGLGRRTRPQLRLEGGQLVVDLCILADLVELLLDVVGPAADVLEHARLEQLVEGARARLHGGDLVLRPLEGGAGVVEGLRDAGRALVDRRDRLGRRVLGLEGLLLGPEVVDPFLQRVEGLGELLLLLGQLLELRLHLVDLLLGGRLAGQRLLGQVLPVGGERLLRLVLEVVDGVLELFFLQLEPLLRARRCRPGPAAPG